MQKLFFKNTLFFLAAAAVWGTCGFFLMQHSPIKGGLNEEGYGINPSSRKYFEFMRNHDPESDQVPENWRQLQQEFANRMPRRADRSLNWEQRGPFNIGGRTRALAIDVLNDNHIGAGGVTS